jgi:uncharacterized protein YqgV (UPF0045/DUF77 family)
MNVVSCQFALYPLGVEDIGPAIDAALAEVRQAGLQVDVGPMSTYMTGDSAALFEGLRRAFDVAAREAQIVMTVTMSNACPLPGS